MHVATTRVSSEVASLQCQAGQQVGHEDCFLLKTLNITAVLRHSGRPKIYALFFITNDIDAMMMRLSLRILMLCRHIVLLFRLCWV